MRRSGLRSFGYAVCLALMLIAAPGIVPAASAQESYGWYGPYDDGCYYWWDGYQWTGDVDCDGDGYTDSASTSYAAGWYGPYDDGCYHWWDGYQWTLDVDCDGDGYVDVAAETYPADWYGPFDDGCSYWWDGTAYTGEYDCDGDGYVDAVEESYDPGWYDVYGDGCLYWFDGTAYSGEYDCDGDGKADVVQKPDDIQTGTTDEYIDSQVAAINQMWSGRFEKQGLDYSTPRLVIAEEPIEVGCYTLDGDQTLENEDWIFYCSSDETIYFGPGNLERVVQSGIAVVQFTVAHEIGHHVQSEMDPNFGVNYSKDTVAYEDQATCMAGVWFHELDEQGTPSDINAAMTFLSTATDEIHGKGEDQIQAFLKGYHDPNSC